MDTNFTITLNVFFLLFFSTACFALYVWWKKVSFTREKFAFAGLAAGLSLSLFVIISIYAQEPPYLAIINLVKEFLGLPYQTPQPPTPEQSILSLLIVAALFWLIIRLHSNWSGAQSVNHYEQLQKRESPNIFRDSYLFFFHDKSLAIYDSAKLFHRNALEGASDSLTWHEQARDLVQLSNRSSSYEFQDNAWHDHAHCWIGTHKGTGETVVLACYDTQPDDSELQKLFEYAAKVRQHQQHTSEKIEFIIALKEGDTDQTTELNGHYLRAVSESRLLDDLINFNDYFRDLRKRVEQDELTGSDLTLSQVYSESPFKLSKDGAVQENLEAFLNTWLTENSQRQIALLGEYGQGKSTNSLMLSYHLMQRFQQNPYSVRIPLLLELRGKSPRTLREDELLSTWAGRYGIDTRALLKLLMAGRLLLIFEGFDEVDLSGDADARIEHFKILWNLCYPKAKIMVTGRPNYFLDDTELKAALGIQEASLERPYCEAVYLAPFNETQIEHSLRQVSTNIRDGILNLAARNPRFYDIVSRPSMLHVVSVLWEKENLAQYGERINSALVMDLFIRNSLERQGGKGQKYDFTPPTASKTKPNFMALSTAERTYFMEGIATYMLIHGLPNQISNKQLEEVVRSLVNSIPDKVSSQTDAQSGESRKPLRQRYDLEHKPEEFQTIFTDVRTCGLLVPDLSRSGSFKFGHKSFAEFLAGKVFAQYRLRKELTGVAEISVCSLVNKLNLALRHVVSQRETMAFAVEWIAGKANNHNDAAEIIFNLLFKQYNYIRRFLGINLKICLRWMAYIENKKIFNMITNLYMIFFNTFLGFANSEVPSVRIWRQCSSYIALSSFIFMILNYLFNTDKVLADKTLYVLKNSLFIISISFILAILLGTPSSIYYELMYGYKKQENRLFWRIFRVWHAICTAAHLERTALKNVIGEKALCLLEEVANQEPHPWTIAESLERLEYRE
ncbi:hypothetical protein BAC3_01283 [uncultured bacterium]|nr:hypothetical protein BAC3_01283 [uncultured bacterium]